MEIKDLGSLREEIDRIDRQMVELFERRMEISKGVAAYKASKNLPVRDPARERDKIHDLCSLCRDENKSYLATVYSSIFEVSRAEQEKQLHPTSPTAEMIKWAVDKTAKNSPEFPRMATVACQGVEGAYSILAAEKLFASPKISTYATFEDVFRAIEHGECSYGVLPIENSNAGSVQAVYDLMMKYHFYIVRTTRLHIDHQLLSKKGTKIEAVKEVFSHPQALEQSMNFLKDMGVKITPCKNTAEAARFVAESERSDVAALSSHACAELYGLETLKSSVQNMGNNHTRFICISKNAEIYPGADKTSIMVVTPHRPGALFRVMSRFDALGINLVRLESRPIPDRDFEFMFYFDFETSVYSREFYQLIAELDFMTEEFRYLGSYTEKA